MELKTVTDPIQLGVGLGVAQHHLEIIKKNHPQGVCDEVNCFIVLHLYTHAQI